MIQPLLIGDLGTPELVVIFAVIVLLFGARKLPDLARSSGQALRIFKAETKELRNEDESSASRSQTDVASGQGSSYDAGARDTTGGPQGQTPGQAQNYVDEQSRSAHHPNSNS